ncbi:MAG: WD40 repeat domain-containing protein [Dongiaceae bacterium]
MIGAADNTRNSAPIAREASFEAAVTGIAFLANGMLAAGLADGSVRLIPLDDTNTIVKASPHAANAAVLCAAMDLDAAGILTSGDDGCLARTGISGDTQVLSRFAGPQVDVLAVSQTGGLRAVAAGREVRLLNRHGETVAATRDHPSSVTGLAFNPKGKRLAVSHYGGVTLWWTGRFGQGPTRLNWAGSHIGVTWSPDGSAVVSSMQDKELHGWQLRDGADMRMSGYAAKVHSMQWLAKPMSLVTAGADCAILWRFTGGGPMGKAPLEIGRGLGRLATSVATHPKQPLIAIGFDDGRVALCDLMEDGAVRLRSGDGERVSALLWSEDGRRLAAATDGGNVSFFDFDAGR